MGMRNSNIILAKNIKLDKDYKAVLNYTENQMLNLVRTNQVYSASNYSFLRDNGRIQLQVPYSVVSQCNYIAFQNPDYSNKWFFAFIDEIIYRGDKNTEISYTIDVYSTWNQYWNPKACFVIREHVVNDSIGANTIPEQLETGEFIINSIEEIDVRSYNYFYCMGVTKVPTGTPVDPDNRVYGGIYSGLVYFIFDSAVNCSKMIRAYENAGMVENIVTIFMIPTSLQFSSSWITADLGSVTGIKFAIVNTTTEAVTMVDEKIININNSLNGYTPKNNKLKCFPYNYLYVTNNAGGTVTYNYEDFIDNTPKFRVSGVITTGCSIKLYPTNYKKFSDENWKTAEYSFGLIGAKYPTCSWMSDSYTNWLTQNSVNIALSGINSVATTAVGVATGNIAGMVGGVTSIAGTLGSVYQHSFMPNQANGDISGGDVTTGLKSIGFYAYRMSIKQEYARSIDDYFTRQGYKVNRTKIPNFGRRENYNFIQVSNESILAYPNGYNNINPTAKDLDTINQLFRNGLTVWNNYDNLGDYSVSNNITSN